MGIARDPTTSARKRSAIVARSEVHRPGTGSAPLEQVFPSAVGEARRHDVCREITRTRWIIANRSPSLI